jgi:hypothetical protein
MNSTSGDARRRLRELLGRCEATLGEVLVVLEAASEAPDPNPEQADFERDLRRDAAAEAPDAGAALLGDIDLALFQLSGDDPGTAAR